LSFPPKKHTIVDVTAVTISALGQVTLGTERKTIVLSNYFFGHLVAVGGNYFTRARLRQEAHNSGINDKRCGDLLLENPHTY